MFLSNYCYFRVTTYIVYVLTRQFVLLLFSLLFSALHFRLLVKSFRGWRERINICLCVQLRCLQQRHSTKYIGAIHSYSRNWQARTPRRKIHQLYDAVREQQPLEFSEEPLFACAFSASLLIENIWSTFQWHENFLLWTWNEWSPGWWQ